MIELGWYAGSFRHFHSLIAIWSRECENNFLDLNTGNMYSWVLETIPWIDMVYWAFPTRISLYPFSYFLFLNP